MDLYVSVLMCLSLSALITYTQSSRILFFVPINGQSHWMYMRVFVDALINRGHEVTCVTSISMGDHKLLNYTEILIDPPFNMQNRNTFLIHLNILRTVRKDDLFNEVSDSPFKTAGIFSLFGNMSTIHAIRDPKVQELIHSTNLHFDLVINEEVYHDVFLAFGHKFGAPTVTICPFGISNFFDTDMGLVTPISHVSHVMLSYTDKMDFGQRWYNTMLTFYDWALRKFSHIPSQNQILEENFGHLENLPSIDELRRNISIVFVNAHRSITFPRPSMPGLVYIGGAHIKAPKPLTDDLQKFLDESEHGVIYFSLGTVVDASKMPKKTLQIFLDTFSKLEQRVVWKFEDDSIQNVPKNVLIRKWLPQNDILAHPNIALFISHGGMFSNFEAVNYGIQMLVIPFVGDQYRNALRVQNAGYGRFMDFRDITEESLPRIINELLTDEQYSMRAKEISAVFRDNIVHPMDEFIWWVEYVIKFRGAAHLKSHAINMSVFTYLLLDILLVNLLIVSVIIFVVFYTMKRLCSKKKKID